MAIFVISYDLNKTKNYEKLWKELERLKCARTLESVWLGSINGTAQSVLEHLKDYVDNDDSLIVAESQLSKVALKRPYTKALEWIRERA